MSVDIGNEGIFVQSDHHTELLRTVIHEREHGKGCYARADAALEELIRTTPIGTVLDLDGKQYELVDKFTNKNTVFAHAGCKRFDVSEMKEK